MSKVYIAADGRLEHIGDWDYQPYFVDIADNPWPGPVEPPDDWDFMWRQEERIANPIPDGVIEEDLEVFFDRTGIARLVRDAESFELESRITASQKELSELMIDIQLGEASPEEIERAKELRTFLKENAPA